MVFTQPIEVASPWRCIHFCSEPGSQAPHRGAITWWTKMGWWESLGWAMKNMMATMGIQFGNGKFIYIYIFMGIHAVSPRINEKLVINKWEISDDLVRFKQQKWWFNGKILIKSTGNMMRMSEYQLCPLGRTNWPVWYTTCYHLPVGCCMRGNF